MEQQVIMSGIGGQGILIIGELLARAAVVEGKSVLFFEEYGGLVRGVMSQCIVVIGTEEIITPPIIAQPAAAAIVMHTPVKHHVPRVKPGGLWVVNTSVVKDISNRNDIAVIPIPATEMAVELGDVMISSMIALGAFIRETGIVSLDSAKNALKQTLPLRRHKFIRLSEQALSKGAEFVEENGNVVNRSAETLWMSLDPRTS